MKKVIFLLFPLTVIFQGCIVYNHNSVPIDHALDQGRAKVVKMNDDELEVNNIIKVEDRYYLIQERNSVVEDQYGLLQSRSSVDSVLIAPSDIQNIYLKDKDESVLLTLSIPVALLLGFLIYFSNVL